MRKRDVFSVQGDLIHAVWCTEYFTAMLEAKVPNTEIHIYASGNHGGGLTHQDGIPFGTWTARCEPELAVVSRLRNSYQEV